MDYILIADPIIKKIFGEHAKELHIHCEEEINNQTIIDILYEPSAEIPDDEITVGEYFKKVRELKA